MVDGIADTETRLVALGAEIIESTRTHIDTGSGTVDLVFLTDPDETRIEIVKFGRHGAWRLADLDLGVLPVPNEQTDSEVEALADIGCRGASG